MATDPADFFACLVEKIGPEAEPQTIAAPTAVELDSDEAWEDFQDTQAHFDAQFLLMQSSKD